MVNLPEQPPTFRPSAMPELEWWWRLESAEGEEVEVTEEEYADQRFPNQSDAESWVGEIWSELAGLGVEAVTLFEGDRRVYGPMSLKA